MSALLFLISACLPSQGVTIPVSDPKVVYSPYNWYHSASYAQSPNPGAYFMLGFTGKRFSVNLDVSPLVEKKVPANQYPVIRYSVDSGPEKTVQLSASTKALLCGEGLSQGPHTLWFKYVAGYVFLDFWSPVNVVRVTGFTADEGAALASIQTQPYHALFLGDSITNGDDDIATKEKGITNEVDTQDATAGYPGVVASGISADYGVVAYGGASWDGRAADGHTPGLMTFATMFDSVHSRLVDGKLSPIPNYIFINMGENAGPSGEDVPKLLSELRSASSPDTKIYLLIPFSGRSRASLTQGFKQSSDKNIFILDFGDNPNLQGKGPSVYSIDGQHPLTILHGILGARIAHAVRFGE